MNNELNHLENYEEFSGLVHEKGSSAVTLTTDQFLAKLKAENKDGEFTGYKGTQWDGDTYPTEHKVSLSELESQRFVEDYEKIYGEPMYCGSAYVETPKKSDLGKYLKKLNLGSDWGNMWHLPLTIYYQSLDLSMLGAKIQKAILEGYGITDLSIGYYSD